MRARERAGTAEALEQYRRSAVGWVWGGVVGLVTPGVLALVLATAFPELPEDSVASDFVPLLAVTGLTSLLFGLGTLRLARRMRRVLDAGDWSAHAVVALPKGVLVLAGPEPGLLLPRRVVAVKERYARVEPGPDGVLWWCGDPRGGGVIAPPGGGELVWTRPVRGSGARRRAIARAELRGLTERPAATDPPQGAADAPALPYASLVEAARRRAVPAKNRWSRKNRPEPDVRTVPWWRVRGLREIAGLGSIGVSLLAAAVLFTFAWLFPEDAPLAWVVGVFVGAGCAVNVVRLLTSGRFAARLLARAAAAPVAVPKRYVALPDPYGGGPVLVVFPEHGGPEDLPEGVLPLVRSSTPGEPVGEVELRGWLDLDVDGRPCVTARAGGRVLWPAGPYLEAGTAEFAAVAERIAPRQEAGVSPA